MTTTTDIVYEIPHGGSGPFGNSAYANRATGCLERNRLERENPRTCGEIYKPTATGLPNAMLIGTMVHGFLELHLGGVALEGRHVLFVDAQCNGFVIPREWQVEARRIFEGWLEVKAPAPGKLLASEAIIDAWIGAIRVQAKIDALWEMPNGELLLEDYKTSGRSGDFYTSGRTRLQMHLYTLAAWAVGYNVQKIQVTQIVKNKKILEHVYPIDLPTPGREAWIVRYLQGALSREATGVPNLRGPECDSCPVAMECAL